MQTKQKNNTPKLKTADQMIKYKNKRDVLTCPSRWHLTFKKISAFDKWENLLQTKCQENWNVNNVSSLFILRTSTLHYVCCLECFVGISLRMLRWRYLGVNLQYAAINHLTHSIFCPIKMTNTPQMCLETIRLETDTFKRLLNK